MIVKKPHPSIEGMHYHYQVGNLNGWCRTKNEAQKAISLLKNRLKKEKVDWSRFIIKGKTTPSLKRSSGSAE